MNWALCSHGHLYACVDGGDGAGNRTRTASLEAVVDSCPTPLTWECAPTRRTAPTTPFVLPPGHSHASLADVVDRARVAHDPVYLTRRGRRVAAVIDADDLERLIDAAEDLADIEAARAARAEMAEGQVAIPWEQVKADLGLA